MVPPVNLHGLSRGAAQLAVLDVLRRLLIKHQANPSVCFMVLSPPHPPPPPPPPPLAAWACFALLPAAWPEGGVWRTLF